MNPNDNINIRFEIQIPVGVTVNTQPSKVPDSKAPLKDGTGIIFNLPNPVPVKPCVNTALGSICASVTATGGNPIYSVCARSYVDLDAIYPMPPNPPPTNNTAGNPNSSNTVWSWNDSTSNPIPGANSVAQPVPPGTYPSNLLVVWWKDGSGTQYCQAQTYLGQTGGTGPCGTSGSGSGSGSPSLVVATASTFPAVWCVEISGFAGPQAVLNNTFALRSDRAAAPPIWRSQGDGHSSPRLELRYLPAKHEWTLNAACGAHGFNVQTINASVFGPLVFHAGAPHGGHPHNPKILAVPII